MDDSLHALGLTDMAEAIADGSITSVAATTACLDALDTTGRRFNAVVSLRRDQALEAAHLADQARAAGRSLGPLHGVPMAHKDLFYRKGEISTGGTKIRKDFVAPVTATVIERLDQAQILLSVGRFHDPKGVLVFALRFAQTIGALQCLDQRIDEIELLDVVETIEVA